MTARRDGAPLTVVIADDEPIAREGLRHMLAAHDWLRVVGEAASGGATVTMVDALRPDVLFLDVEMPGGTGVDVLQRLTHRPFVVFTTAFSQHAVTAFELGAVDYLLKPFGGDRLQRALERVRAGAGEPAEDASDRLQEALRHGAMSRLFVRSGASVIPVAVEQITRVEAWGDYVTAYTTSSRYVVHLALQRLADRLDPARFVRVHRAHLVNLAHVKAFRPQPGGGLVAEMLDGASVPVSRTHARTIRALGR
ncbi:MAG TPA: LytTR family DNA-binding domain-containing protein [Gemmatimonadaceae bacterium]|nr:LytTR family DNA-binding domain-containing protein [Gemmatimonadaceae bacterium]